MVEVLEERDVLWTIFCLQIEISIRFLIKIINLIVPHILTVSNIMNAVIELCGRKTRYNEKCSIDIYMRECVVDIHVDEQHGKK